MHNNQESFNAEIKDIINLFPSAITIYKIVEPLNDGNNNYQCIYVNKQAIDLFQITESDFLNKTILENFPLLSQSDLYQKIEAVVKNNTTENVEYKRVGKDEWWQINIAKYKDGFITSTIDITEKRIKEIELEIKDKHLAESMRMLKMSNYEIDLINNIVNYELDYFKNVLEEANHRILNVAEMLEYVADEDKTTVVLKIENTIDDEKWSTFEYKINLKNGNSKYLECTLKGLFENKICVKLYGTIRDITERKLYELTLVEKQYQLHLSNELQQLGMLEYFPETNIYKIDSNIKAILEEPNLPNELSVDEYYEYVYEEDIEGLKRKVNLAIALYKKIKVQRKLKLKNSKIKYVEIVCIPKLENDKLIKYTGTFKDITYQLANENGTSTNQFIISEINKSENVGTWEYNLITNQIILSKELNEIYEEELKEYYTVDEYFEYLYEEDRLKVAEFFKENILAKRKFDVTRKIKLKNQKSKYIQIKASPIIENEQLIKYVGTVIDITEKHLNDLALQTSEARFRLFFEHNPIMYFIVNAHGTILSVNNYGIQHLGYTREELINQNVLKVFYEDDKEKAKQKLEEVTLSKLNSNQWELRKVKKNGDIIWVKETAKSTKDIDGNVMFLILCEDISKEVENRKILEQKNSELVIQKDIAESISIERQRFASIISHEIRTPLNAVLGISNLLLMDNPNPSQIENLNTLKYSAENLMLLVNDILDLTKLESGQIKIEKTTFNLQHILNNIHQTFASKAIEKKLDFKISIDHKIPSALIGDPIRIVQILNNLVANALKYTNYGIIELGVVRKELISSSEIKIKFEIKDTGIGIPYERQDSIFEMFANANSENILKHNSSGLGLSITNKLVKAFGSKINISSKPGEGSIFT
ncbi:MAG: Autoinducer 2 sensor kinase/phosphatase LuxQ, partial [Bacteroidota bacterium]